MTSSWRPLFGCLVLVSAAGCGARAISVAEHRARIDRAYDVAMGPGDPIATLRPLWTTIDAFIVDRLNAGVPPGRLRLEAASLPGAEMDPDVIAGYHFIEWTAGTQRLVLATYNVGPGIIASGRFALIGYDHDQWSLLDGKSLEYDTFQVFPIPSASSPIRLVTARLINGADGWTHILQGWELRNNQLQPSGSAVSFVNGYPTQVDSGLVARHDAMPECLSASVAESHQNERQLVVRATRQGIEFVDQSLVPWLSAVDAACAAEKAGDTKRLEALVPDPRLRSRTRFATALGLISGDRLSGEGRVSVVNRDGDGYLTLVVRRSTNGDWQIVDAVAEKGS